MMNFIKHTLCFGLTIFFASLAFGQIDSTWTKVYGGNREDKAHDIISTADSGFLVIGSTSSFGFDNSQMYFLKLDSLGNIMWSKSHGGTGQESGKSVIQTKDGGFLGVGYTSSWGSGGFDLLLVKLNANGNLEYERYFGGADWDFANDVIETDSNMFVIAGETQSFGNGGKDGWIVRYDANNDLFDWNKTFGGQNTEYYNSISSTATGFIVAGGGTSPNRIDEDVFITNFSKIGDTIWTRYFGDTLQDYANDIIQRSNSDFVFTGLISDSNYQEIFLLQLDTNGVKKDSNIWQLNSNRIGYRVNEMDSGRIGLSGSIDIGSTGSFNLFYGLTKPNSLHYQKASIYGSAKPESGGYFDVNSDSTLIIAGSTLGYSSNFSNVILIKTLKDGSYQHTNYTFNNDTSNALSINRVNPNQTNIIFNSRTRTFQFAQNLCGKKYSIINTSGLLIQEGIIKHQKEVQFLNKQPGLYILHLNTNTGYHLKFFNP